CPWFQEDYHRLQPSDMTDKDADISAASVPEEKKATEFLANERTFLAWIRTSIAVITLGVVVAKFGESAASANPQLQTVGVGASIPTGLTHDRFLGGVLSILAAWRYHVVNRNILSGKIKADRGLVILITIIVVLLSLVTIIYCSRPSSACDRTL